MVVKPDVSLVQATDMFTDKTPCYPEHFKCSHTVRLTDTVETLALPHSLEVTSDLENNVGVQ